MSYLYILPMKEDDFLKAHHFIIQQYRLKPKNRLKVHQYQYECKQLSMQIDVSMNLPIDMALLCPAASLLKISSVEAGTQHIKSFISSKLCPSYNCVITTEAFPFRNDQSTINEITVVDLTKLSQSQDKLYVYKRIDVNIPRFQREITKLIENWYTEQYVECIKSYKLWASSIDPLNLLHAKQDQNLYVG